MLTLVRFKKYQTGTMGVLRGEGIGTYFTLERTDKLLPDGTYNIVCDYSPKFKAIRPHLWNDSINKSRGFRIHEGNTVYDTEGCILVGNASRLDEVRLWDSKAALNQLIGELTKHTDEKLLIKTWEV